MDTWLPHIRPTPVSWLKEEGCGGVDCEILVSVVEV